MSCLRCQKNSDFEECSLANVKLKQYSLPADLSSELIKFSSPLSLDELRQQRIAVLSTPALNNSKQKDEEEKGNNHNLVDLTRNSESETITDGVHSPPIGQSVTELEMGDENQGQPIKPLSR